jgi:Ca2+-transporting ATPase
MDVAMSRAGVGLDGLTAEEAARRLLVEGRNELPVTRDHGLLQQFWSVISQPMLVLLLVAGTVNFLLAELSDGIVLMVSVVVVIVISVYQEHKTENALAALRDLSSPRALVVRDGKLVRIAGAEVVAGDVVMINEADRVPADAVLVEAASLTVDESALTGESVPVRKEAAAAHDTADEIGAPGGDGTPWVFSGTLVVKGHGTAIVRRTGARTELGRIGSALHDLSTERTPLQYEVDRLVRVIAVLAGVTAVAVVVVYALTRGHWLEGVLAGVATAMALVPEEFPVVLTVFLALGAWRMSQRNVLTRRPPVIETLGSATAVCVDKTGTLTTNTMVVREFVVDGRVHRLDGNPLPEQYRRIAETGALAVPPDPFDPMDRAFRDVADAYLPGTQDRQQRRPVREYPLSEDLLAVAMVWCPREGGELVVAVKGAPEAVADLCRLGDVERRALRDQVERSTASGLRVLAVASGAWAGSAALPESPAGFDLELLGLACLQDPVRPEVPAAVARCRQAGVRVLMITGDYLGTALAIARESGIDTTSGAMTGSELVALSDAELAERVRTVNVYARMVPDQKLRLVRALKATGEVVGMTGDGVNDAPALKAADIGIAMGGRGTDVAREAADLVITDDDFASIVDGIHRGRGIFDNLRKAMGYLVAVHVPILGMALLPVFVSGWPLVLLPVQIAFLEFIIDPACSVVFEAEQIDPGIMRQRPRRVGDPVFGRRRLTIAALQGLAVLCCVVGVYLWAVLSDRPDTIVRSIAFTVLVVGNLCLIMVNRSWRLPVWSTVRRRRNRAVKWVISGAAATLVLVLTVSPLRALFDLGRLGLLEAGVAVGAGIVGVAWFEIYKIIRRTRPAAVAGSDSR